MVIDGPRHTCDCAAHFRVSPYHSWENPHGRPFVDGFRVTCRFERFKESDDLDMVFWLEEVRFHLQPNLLHQIGNTALNSIVVPRGTINKSVRLEVDYSGVMLVNHLRTGVLVQPASLCGSSVSNRVLSRLTVQSLFPSPTSWESLSNFLMRMKIFSNFSFDPYSSF